MTDQGAASPIIEVHGISKSFGTTRALSDVSLSVAPGTVQGLLGPNGSGKTTLVRILSTLLSPDAGNTAICGIDPQRDPHGVRALIGLAGQYAAVDESLTGRENLELVGRLYRLSANGALPQPDESCAGGCFGAPAGRVVTVTGEPVRCMNRTLAVGWPTGRPSDRSL